jgi:hypothetical protein
MSILAEEKLVGVLLSKRVLDETLVALLAQIVAEKLVGFVDIRGAFFHFAQEIADRLHVIIIQVGLGKSAWVVGGIGLDLNHVTLFPILPKLSAAMIAREMQHRPLILSCLYRNSRRPLGRKAGVMVNSMLARKKPTLHPSQV